MQGCWTALGLCVLLRVRYIDAALVGWQPPTGLEVQDPGSRAPDLTAAAPQLAMHSIREMCAVDDVAHAYNHFRAFFADFSALDACVDVDALPPPDVRGTVENTPCEHTAH